MQTFLPFPDFAQSARCLDRQRLGKQRSEVLQTGRDRMPQGRAGITVWAQGGGLGRPRGRSPCKLGSSTEPVEGAPLAADRREIAREVLAELAAEYAPRAEPDYTVTELLEMLARKLENRNAPV